MDPDRFKNATEGWKNVALVIAVAVGGLWTAWIFGLRREPERAQADLEKAKAELSQIQREINGKAAPSIDISASTIASDDWPRTLLVKVTLDNAGTRDITLTYDDAKPIAAARVDFQPSGVISFDDIVFSKSWSIYAKGGVFQTSDEVVLAGGKTSLEGLLRIARPGLYLVTFASRYQQREVAELKQSAAAATSNPYYCSRSIYVVVQ